MNNTAVIYARVSSIGERQSNERQIEDLKILGKLKNYIIEKIYEEKISGAKKNVERPILTIFIAIQFLHNRCLFYYSTTSYEAFCSCFAWRNFSCIVGLP